MVKPSIEYILCLELNEEYLYLSYWSESVLLRKFGLVPPRKRQSMIRIYFQGKQPTELDGYTEQWQGVHSKIMTVWMTSKMVVYSSSPVVTCMVGQLPVYVDTGSRWALGSHTKQFIDHLSHNTWIKILWAPFVIPPGSDLVIILLSNQPAGGLFTHTHPLHAYYIQTWFWSALYSVYWIHNNNLLGPPTSLPELG